MKEGIPQGLKPNFVVGVGDPRLKPWATQKQKQRELERNALPQRQEYI
jgi:hypothetical protein